MRIESVEEFISGIPFRRSAKSVSIYFPTHAQFQVYDVILACWGENLERQLYGYQLKEGSTVPMEFAMEDLFIRSYLIRGRLLQRTAAFDGGKVQVMMRLMISLVYLQRIGRQSAGQHCETAAPL